MQSGRLQPHVLTVRTLLTASEDHLTRLGILTRELFHSEREDGWVSDDDDDSRDDDSHGFMMMPCRLV